MFNVVVSFIKDAIYFIGIPSVIVACIYLGRKLQKLEDVDSLVRVSVIPRLDRLEDRMGGVEKRLSVVETTMAHVSKTMDAVLEVLLQGRAKS